MCFESLAKGDFYICWMKGVNLLFAAVLSKIYSSRPWNKEQFTKQIADNLSIFNFAYKAMNLSYHFQLKLCSHVTLLVQDEIRICYKQTAFSCTCSFNSPEICIWINNKSIVQAIVMFEVDFPLCSWTFCHLKLSICLLLHLIEYDQLAIYWTYLKNKNVSVDVGLILQGICPLFKKNMHVVSIEF